MLHQTFQTGFARLSLQRRSISAPTPGKCSSNPVDRQNSTSTISSSGVSIIRQTDQSILLTPTQPPCLPEIETTIQWKYAHQGSTILATAIKEAQHNDARNRAFTRQLYIHALSYLLQGLPDNLSTAEVTTLQHATPEILQKPTPVPSKQAYLSRPGTGPSFLHRVLASWIIDLFLFLRFIIPYLTFFLTKAYDYERTNHISERFLANSLSATDTVGTTCINILKSIMASGNGRTGEIVIGGLAWWIEGVLGGLHEGIGEGLEILGARKGRSFWRRSSTTKKESGKGVLTY